MASLTNCGASARTGALTQGSDGRGPTLSDTNGKSLLDGTGLYAKSFRAARRL